MSSNVKEVTTDSFDAEVVSSELPVVVDFWAPWCGPCLTVAPIFEDLSKSYLGKVKFVKINVDNNRELASKFNVRGVPNFVFLKNGSLINQIAGAMRKEELSKVVDSLIA